MCMRYERNNLKQYEGTGSTLITLKDIEIMLGNVPLKQRGTVQAMAHYYWEDEEPASYVDPGHFGAFTLECVALNERMMFINECTDFGFFEMCLEQSVDLLQYISEAQEGRLTELVEQALCQEALE
jgi:hypothetical protein